MNLKKSFAMALVSVAFALAQEVAPAAPASTEAPAQPAPQPAPVVAPQPQPAPQPKVRKLRSQLPTGQYSVAQYKEWLKQQLAMVKQFDTNDILKFDE